jgi:hypothetical protein
MFRNKDFVISHLAHTCYFAQDHVQLVENESDRWFQLEAVSHIVSCYLCRVTVDGQDGVDWDVIIEKLAGERLSVDQWKNEITNLINEFGGFFLTSE